MPRLSVDDYPVNDEEWFGLREMFQTGCDISSQLYVTVDGHYLQYLQEENQAIVVMHHMHRVYLENN